MVVVVEVVDGRDYPILILIPVSIHCHEMARQRREWAGMPEDPKLVGSTGQTASWLAISDVSEYQSPAK